MARLKEIYDYLCALAPLELQMDFDNAGLQIGHPEAEISRVLLALDITEKVIDEAVSSGAELIISHHPLIFHPVKSLNDEDLTARKLYRLAENKIAAISMHTNLDIAQGGVNDVLIRELGAAAECALDAENCGRVGELPKEMPLSDFLLRCKSVLYTSCVKYYDSGRSVRRIAVMGGSGGSALADAVRHGCDTYITADIKYNTFLDAADYGINLIDADHFGTENPVIPYLAAKLRPEFKDVEFTVSKEHCQIVSFM